MSINEKIDWEALRKEINVIIPDGVKIIPSKSFMGSEIVSIEIPASVEQIEQEAFLECRFLKTVEIAEGSKLKSIYKKAFKGCGDLNQIELPYVLHYIGAEAFSSTGIEKIYVYGNLIDWGEKSFEHCKQLKSVTIGEGIRVIPKGTFSYCNGLKEISLPTTLNEIGHKAFNMCSKLQEIQLPVNLDKIESMAFHKCHNLERVLGLSSTKLKIIPERAFDQCVNISQVEFPSCLKHIGLNAFDGCNNITYIDLPRELEYISKNTFQDCPKLTKLRIPYSITDKVGFNWIPEKISHIIFDDLEVSADDNGEINFIENSKNTRLANYYESIYNICLSVGRKKAMEAMISYAGMAG